MGSLNQYFQRIKSGYSLVLLFNTVNALSLGFASLYFQTQGLPLFKIVLVSAVSTATSLVVLLLSRTYYLKLFLLLGSLAYTAQAMTLLFYADYSYILYGMLGGIGLAWFWVSLNYVFFSRSSLQHHAKDSSVYFLIGPILGMVLPPAGAFIIGSVGFQSLFCIAAALTSLPLVYIARRIPAERISVPFRESVRAYSGLKLIAFMEGSLHFFKGSFIKVYILIFLTTEYAIGGFNSYLALIGFAVTVIFAYYSDKQRKRSAYLTPSLLLMGVLIIALGFVHTPTWWLVLIGAYAFFDDVTLPIRFAIRMDYKKKDLGFWKISEFYENFGRTVILGLAGLFIFMHIAWPAFILFALLAFGYPFVVHRVTKRMSVVGGTV